MAKGKVTYKSHKKEVKIKMQKARESSLVLVGEFLISTIALAMTRLGIVDTGRLRASISYVVGKVSSFGKLQYSKDELNQKDRPIGVGEGTKLVVGTNVFYAIFQEKLRPYLKPSAIRNIGQIRKLFLDSYEKEMK